MKLTVSNTVEKNERATTNVMQAKQRFLHPVHSRYHGEETPPGIRFANSITGFMGSWTFLVLQTIVVIVWIALNVVVWFRHFDPYPFILLNLAFSTQAAYAAPLILMAGNVAAARDRELWENDYQTNQNAYAKIEDLEKQIKLVVEQNQTLLELLFRQNESLKVGEESTECSPKNIHRNLSEASQAS